MAIPTTVIVPVHDALPQTVECLSSLAAAQANARVVVINDGSRDPHVAPVLSELGQRFSFTVINRSDCQGFTRTANEGLRLAKGHAVLLNSDTRVTVGWLEGLERAASHTTRVGSVTPFSNAGSICSLLEYCVDRPLPAGFDEHDLQALLSQVSPVMRPAIPTGIGFCMLLTQEAREAVGLLDADAFPIGYGEENDWCQRATAMGFSHHLADDVFVYHQGSASFGVDRERLLRDAEAYFRRRWPSYYDELFAFINAESLQPWLETFADALRRATRAKRAGRLLSAARVLHVLHANPVGPRVCGAEFHVQQIAKLARQFEHVFLWPEPEGLVGCTDLAGTDAATLFFPRTDGKEADWSTALAALNPNLVHVHNSNHWPQSFLPWLVNRWPVVATIHDYYWACSRFTLLHAESNEHCGVPTDHSVCGACLNLGRAPERSIGRWRAAYEPALKKIRSLIAPSHAAANTLTKAFPSLTSQIEVLGNPLFPPPHLSSPPHPRRDWPVRVLLLGYRDEHKGTHKLIPLATALPHLEFHVLGMEPLSGAPPNLKFHGFYNHDEVYRRIHELDCNLAVFLSQCPETFSYTLSEVLAVGLPALVPDLGAMRERVTALGAGWTYRASSFDDLVEKLRTIAADPRERAFRARVAASQSPAIDGEVFANRLSEIYRRALMPVSPFESDPVGVPPPLAKRSAKG